MSGQQASLEVKRDGAFVERRDLDDTSLTIGRSLDNHLVIAHPAVSRQHARIDCVDGVHLLVDLTGRSATLVNGQPVNEHSLIHGDQIAIGPVNLSYACDRPALPNERRAPITETLLVFSPMGHPLYETLRSKAEAEQLSLAESSLWSVAAAMRECKSQSEAVRRLLELVAQLVPSDRSQIVYPRPEGQLQVAAFLPARDERQGPISESVVRQVLATGQALACLDVGQDRRFRASQSLAGVGARSLLAVPLVVSGRVAAAVCLVREGAAEPFVADHLQVLCAITQIAVGVAASLLIQRDLLRADGTGQYRRQADLPYPLVYRSQVMHRVTEQVLRVASTQATVLIAGPSGTGKELIASAIHYGSLRSDGAFVKVNCAAIPENLIESELFGHEQGAFTDARSMRKGRFETAHGGTLFLDEIGDMPLAVQTKLLRVLETREIERVGGQTPIPVDVRLIAATHHDLPTMVRERKFREDLWYRLDVVRIDVPALKLRSEDIPLLFRLFAQSFAESMQVDPVTLSEEAIEQMMAYPWPGNVRQLRNVAERLTVFHPGQEVPAPTAMSMIGEAVSPDLSGDSLPAGSSSPRQREDSLMAGAIPPSDAPLQPLADARAEFERIYVRRALESTGGNITKAAELLGLARENLSRKIKQLGIVHP